MIGWILFARAKRRLRELRALAREPQAVQEPMLLRMVDEASRTRFGRAHGFDEIRSIADFRARVPLQDYGSLQPYLERARGGATGETWPGAAVAFAGSGERFLPETKDSIRSRIAGAKDALAAYLFRARDRGLLRGRLVFLGGRPLVDEFPSGMPYGDATGILAEHTPWWLRPWRSPSPAILSLADRHWKLEAAARELAQRDVRLLVGLPSWSLLLLDAVERLAGRSIRDAWPSLRGFIHGGVAFGPYREIFRKRAGRDVTFVETYTATAGGVLAVQDKDGGRSLAPLLDRNVYFEFVGEDGVRRGLHEVEAGVRYAVHVSTDAGLWAYALDDTVEFTSTRPPRLRVLGSTRFPLNAFGERVRGEQLEAAARAAAQEAGCRLTAYSVVPEYPDIANPKGRHVWVVECGAPPADLDAFARALDAALQRESEEYRAHRDGDLLLRPPRVRLVRSGAFDEWAERRGGDAAPLVLDRERARELAGGW